MDSTFAKGGAKNTPYPEDARPNPLLGQTYEALPGRMSNSSKIAAHSKAIGGMSLHMRK